MSELDFKNSVKESNLLIEQSDFSSHLLTCTILEFLDKVIIHLAMDGETDISYDIEITGQENMKRPLRNYDYNDDSDEEFESSNIANSTIVPTVLIGPGDNVKVKVLASQIGHLMSRLSTKNIILNISGKIFGKPKTQNVYHANDSLIMKQTLHLTQQTFLSAGANEPHLN